MLFAATFALFKTERTGTGKSRWLRKTKVAAQAAHDAPRVPTVVMVPRVTPVFGAKTYWHQFSKQLRFDTLGVLKSVPFLVMLAFGMANFIPSALFNQNMYDTGIYPVTSQMLSALQGSFSFLLIFIVLFYSGELIWKERAAKLNEVTDAMPVPNWVPLLAKFLALVAVIACFQAIGALTAMVIQLCKGYTQLEPLVYAKTLALDSVVYILMGGLALVLQVFTNNKYAGYALLVVVLVGHIVLGTLY